MTPEEEIRKIDELLEMLTMMETETVEDVQEELEVVRPSMWVVIMHNDDTTTMDFVIMLLMQLFHKNIDEATKIMLEIHVAGRAVVGCYTHEIAEEKMNTATRTARTYGFPLAVTIEEDSE